MTSNTRNLILLQGVCDWDSLGFRCLCHCKAACWRIYGQWDGEKWDGRWKKERRANWDRRVNSVTLANVSPLHGTLGRPIRRWSTNALAAGGNLGLGLAGRSGPSTRVSGKMKCAAVPARATLGRLWQMPRAPSPIRRAAPLKALLPSLRGRGNLDRGHDTYTAFSTALS